MKQPNLKTATAQEIFTYVKNHLLKQNQKSRTLDGSCRYRTKEGLMCAAGCLLPDTLYTPEMESVKWQSLASVRKVTKRHTELIQSLQNVHDHREVNEWQEALKDLATLNNLKY